MRRTALLVLVSFFTLDRLFKYIAFKQSLLSSGEIIRFGVFSFTPFLNNQLAFSLPLPLALIITLSLSAITVLIAYFFKLHSFFQRAALSFVILGALSNLFDRVAYHTVIDYLSIFPNGFFNIADIMISGGIIALFWSMKKHSQL